MDISTLACDHRIQRTTRIPESDSFLAFYEPMIVLDKHKYEK